MLNRVTVILFVGLLAGCGGGSGGDGAIDSGTASGPALGGSGLATAVGVITVEQTSEALAGFDEADASAFFVSVNDDDLRKDTIIDALFPLEDTCTVEEAFTDDINFDLGDIPGSEGLNTTLVSAGGVLTLSSPAGTYASLALETAFGLLEYSTNTDLVFPVPSNLTVNIPGENFPPFTSAAVPEVMPLTGVSASTESDINETTVITWDPGTDPEARINLFFETEREFFNSFLEVVRIECVVLDDGSFAFPETTQQDIGSGFSTDEFDIYRTAFNVVENANSALLILRAISINEGSR